MDDGVRQRAPHRRAARPHHPPCPYPGDERRELPAQAEPVTTPATVRITPRLAPWAHRPLPRAGRRQPRGGRVAPRAGPSHGLRGQAPTQPAVHFYAAAPVHFYAAVDRGATGSGNGGRRRKRPSFAVGRLGPLRFVGHPACRKNGQCSKFTQTGRQDRSPLGGPSMEPHPIVEPTCHVS